MKMHEKKSYELGKNIPAIFAGAIGITRTRLYD